MRYEVFNLISSLKMRLRVGGRNWTGLSQCAVASNRSSVVAAHLIRPVQFRPPTLDRNFWDKIKLQASKRQAWNILKSATKLNKNLYSLTCFHFQNEIIAKIAKHSKQT